MGKCYIDDEEVRHHAFELILDLEHMYDDGKIDEGTFAYLLSEVNKFNFFTPADVKPVVRGEWIDKGESPFCDSEGRMYFNHEYGCSNCGYTIRGGELKYCPNCGADMRSNHG